MGNFTQSKGLVSLGASAPKTVYIDDFVTPPLTYADEASYTGNNLWYNDDFVTPYASFLQPVACENLEQEVPWMVTENVPWAVAEEQRHVHDIAEEEEITAMVPGALKEEVPEAVK